jgi:RNA polymerase sigma factor (sigma-70 family)
MTRDERITSCLPLVHRIARKFTRRDACPAHYDDVVGDGIVGLVKASDDFDPARGLAFTTYAWVRIVRAIRDGLRSRDYLTRDLRAQVNRGEIAPITHVEVDVHHAVTRGADTRAIDVRRAVNRLPHAERYAVQAVYYDDQHVQSVDPFYSRSWNSQTHQAALRRLRTSLGAYERTAA